MIGGAMTFKTQDIMMKTLKIRDRISALRRVYPSIDPATRYLYAGRLNRKASSARVAIYLVAWSTDGRVTLHRTEFQKTPMTVAEWWRWLDAHAPNIVLNQVRSYMNRTFGSTWNIEQIFGWHLLPEGVQ